MRTDQTRVRVLLAALAALALTLGIAACGGGSDTTSSETSESGGESSASAAAIQSNPDNGKVSLTIGSKNFPEQEILGESTRRPSPRPATR